jgi:DNA mismatch repair ATPase MutS
LTSVLEALMDNVQPCLQWLAELDVCMALADVSSQQAFSRPRLVDDNVLHIVKGALAAAAPSRHARHPVISGSDVIICNVVVTLHYII